MKGWKVVTYQETGLLLILRTVYAGAPHKRLRSILFDPFTFLPSQAVLRLRSHLHPSKAVLQRNYCFSQ